MKPLLILTFIVFFSGTGFSQNLRLSLEITGLKVIEESMVRVAVYNSKDTYFDSEQMFRSAEKPVVDSTMIFIFDDMPAGSYAITIYHDEDNDGEMDRKWFGPPKEGYGFSNNYHSTFKPASFEDAKFELEENLTLNIKMRY